MITWQRHGKDTERYEFENYLFEQKKLPGGIMRYRIYEDGELIYSKGIWPEFFSMCNHIIRSNTKPNYNP